MSLSSVRRFGHEKERDPCILLLFQFNGIRESPPLGHVCIISSAVRAHGHTDPDIERTDAPAPGRQQPIVEGLGSVVNVAIASTRPWRRQYRWSIACHSKPSTFQR